MRRIIASAVILFAISSTAVRAGQNVVVKHGKGASTGMITETLAALTGSRVPLDKLGLLYGNYFDLSAPFVEVTTHWTGEAG